MFENIVYLSLQIFKTLLIFFMKSLQGKDY